MTAAYSHVKKISREKKLGEQKITLLCILPFPIVCDGGEMSQIKGALLIDFAKLIRENKNRDWKKYLNEDDLKLIFGTVLPNFWYPIGTYERAGFAIFKEIGQGQKQNAWVWGKFLIEDLGKKYYKNLVQYQDPIGSFQRCQTFLNQWFKFDDPKFQAIEVEQLAPNQVKITVRYDHPLDFFEASVYQVAGSMERIAELNGGKEVNTKVTEINAQDPIPSATIIVSWK